MIRRSCLHCGIHTMAEGACPNCGAPELVPVLRSNGDTSPGSDAPGLDVTDETATERPFRSANAPRFRDHGPGAIGAA